MSDAYAQAGVDIAAGNAAVAKYKEVLSAARHPDQLDVIGGFGGLFRMPRSRKSVASEGNRTDNDADEQVLAASTDGVGTKILIAAELRRYDGVGRDLVNHCVNDILVVNARPLFFLDYFATGKLDPDVATEVVRGCASACRTHDCALLGGETAEMPGVYAPGHFDLAGTIVGVVYRDDVPNPNDVEPGDVIIGLPSVGLHTNGYSLARVLIPSEEWLKPFHGQTYADALLAEHPSYYTAVRAMQAVAKVKTMAHITGGGLLENVPRTLPPNVKAIFDPTTWSVPLIMQELVRRGNLSHEEQYRTFNMGIGYTLVVPKEEVERAVRSVQKIPGMENATIIGKIEARNADDPPVLVSSRV